MNTVKVNEIILTSKFNRFHLQILLACIFIIVVDGYDMFMLGAILPPLMEEWNIPPVSAGVLSSYALVGMMIGALVFGPVADKIGRKKVILISTIIFSVFTFTSGFSNGVTSFGVQRFLAGIGLGGVMPNLVAVITEYAPRKLKSTLVAIMFSGHALGGVVASLSALAILPNFGWRPVVWLGVLPLLTLPLLYKLLPETPNFLVKNNHKDQLAAILKKIDPSQTFNENANYDLGDETHQAEKDGFPVKKLFTGGRTLSTIMFWVAYFMTLLVMYALSTWLPKLMVSAGYELGSSLLFLVTLNLGAVTGAILGGKIADAIGSRKVLVTFFILGFVSLTLLSFKPSMFWLYVLIAIAGATTTGTQIVMNAYVSQFYPTEIRSTGLGWALGIGRLGGMLGPTLGGFLLNAQLTLQMNFLAFAIPSILAAIAIWFIQERYSAIGKNTSSYSKAS